MKPPTPPSSVLVVGAGGVLGQEIVRLLRAKGFGVLAAYRTQRAGLNRALSEMGAEPLQLDVNDIAATRQALSQVKAAIFTPILTVVQTAAPLLGKDQSAVFLSSNNVTIDPKDAVYAALLRAEAAVLVQAPQARIVRPTMIYGYPGDGNLSKLMAAMGRMPIMPLPGNGIALQQPIFYADLARAAVNILLAPPGQPITIVAGPKPVSQRQLYQLTAAAAGARPFIMSLPVSVFTPVLSLLERIGLGLSVKSAQLRRAGLDKAPKGAGIVRGETSLEVGLSRLAARLNDRSHDG